MSTPTTEKSSVAVRSSRWSRRISRMAFENSLYATSTAWPSCLPGHRSRRRRCDARLTAEGLAARGESPTAFGRRCIPSPPQRGCRVGDPGSGCVAPPSNIPDILGRRALPGVPSVAATLGAPAGRIASLDATLDLHHGLLAAEQAAEGGRAQSPAAPPKGALAGPSTKLGPAASTAMSPESQNQL